MLSLWQGQFFFSILHCHIEHFPGIFFVWPLHFLCLPTSAGDTFCLSKNLFTILYIHQSLSLVEHHVPREAFYSLCYFCSVLWLKVCVFIYRIPRKWLCASCDDNVKVCVYSWPKSLEYFQPLCLSVVYTYSRVLLKKLWRNCRKVKTDSEDFVL